MTALLSFRAPCLKSPAMNCLRSILFCLLAFALVSCSSFNRKKDTAPVKVAWSFDIQADASGHPRGSVFLQVESDRVLVHPNVETSYKLIAPSDYMQHKIPGDALAACTTYGSSRGEELFVMRDKKQLVVYGRLLDEEGGSTEFRVRQFIPIR